jgi:ectoine hydroxylase-related dioxygenase (phytanoyl-CoA dioxygenase family)
LGSILFMAYTLGKEGFEIVPLVLTEPEVAALKHALSSLQVAPGHRNLTQRVSEIANLARSTKLVGLLSTSLGRTPFLVRSLFFDKTPKANWLVPWHQDLSIAVRKRLDLPGYGPWSIKEGVPHVQPPLLILEGMVTIRLHLDDCDKENGAVQVLPGSHEFGRLDASSIARIRLVQEPVTCSARRGDALIMRPLLLHASPPACSPSHRRVIHLEYSTGHLQEGLEWAEGPRAC